MPRFPITLIPLILAVSATAWFVIRPGYGTFFLAVLAFLLWMAARFAAFLLRQLLSWRGRIESALGITLGETPSISKSDLPRDPAFQGMIEDLRRAESAPVFREPARRALVQLTRLPELSSRFEAALLEKLNPGEITHERYQAAGRRVFDSTLQELGEATRRMREFLAIERGEGEGSPQLALRQLRHEQRAEVDKLLDRSEEALSEMARIHLAVSKMRGRDARRSPELEAALGELRELAERTRKY